MLHGTIRMAQGEVIGGREIQEAMEERTRDVGLVELITHQQQLPPILLLVVKGWGLSAI